MEPLEKLEIIIKGAIRDKKAEVDRCSAKNLISMFPFLLIKIYNRLLGLLAMSNNVATLAYYEISVLAINTLRFLQIISNTKHSVAFGTCRGKGPHEQMLNRY